MLWSTLRRAFFQLDAERAHRLVMSGLRTWSSIARVDRPPTDVARHPALARRVLDLDFPNVLGLAAGFDKDVEAVPAWQALGFGFIEVGTVTALPQPGNPKPRLFRLPEDEALLNRLGFNNEGAAHAALALEALRRDGRVRVPVGVNIGKSKVVENEDAPADYAASFELVADVADYLVVNISSPNTQGLRDLQTRDGLTRILDAIMGPNSKRERPVPVLVKLAPDLHDDDARDCAETALQGGARGLVVSNTTIARTMLRGPIPEGPGGISGRPVFARSTQLLSLLTREFKPRLAFIGVGGVASAEHALAKLRAGADLVQAYTGFVYGGPLWPRAVCSGLVAQTALLERPAPPDEGTSEGMVGGEA